MLPQGDVGYVLPVFPFLNIAVLFWDKDEEFEAQANMLFDSEITEFMHEENVVCVWRRTRCIILHWLPE